MSVSRVEVIGIKLPLISPGDDLAKLIVEYAERSGVGIREGDVVVVTEKVVSKSLGLMVDADSVEPSSYALRLSRAVGLDPRFVELVVRECDGVLAVVPIRDLVRDGVVDLESLAYDREAARKLLEEYPCFFIVEKEGMLWSDSGIDASNAPPGKYVIPPKNHDDIAREMHERIRELTGRYVAVVICDTEFFLDGSIDFARGSWGIDPADRLFGAPDLYGKPKYGGVDIVVHEVCSAAALLMRQTKEGVPVAIVRGLSYRRVDRGLRQSLPKIDLEKAVAKTLKATLKIRGFKWLIRALLRTLTD